MEQGKGGRIRISGIQGREIIRGNTELAVLGAVALAELDGRGSREDEELRAGAGDAASSSPPNLLQIKVISSSWMN